MNNTQNKNTILLTLAIDFESLKTVSGVIRFPEIDAKPFESEILLPNESLQKLKDDYEKEIANQRELIREVEEQKVIAERRKALSKNNGKNEIPGQKTLFEEEACT